MLIKSQQSPKELVQTVGLLYTTPNYRKPDHTSEVNSVPSGDMKHKQIK